MTLAFEKRGRQEAIDTFRPFAPSTDSEPQSQLEANLRENSISDIDLGMSPTSFQELSDQYATCIEYHRRWLNFTAGNFNKDGDPEDGHVRKNKESNSAGMQTKDPKNVYHFNNNLVEWWLDEGKYVSERAPREFVEFMENGIELHRNLTKSAFNNIVTPLGESYKNMPDFYFPGGSTIGNVTLRMVIYDAYKLYNDKGELIVEQGGQVAKPHFDRGGLTTQIYSSAPGFWIQPQPKTGKRRPTDPKLEPEYGYGKSQVFPGIEHRIVYGSQDNITALYHGVDRIFDESLTEGPRRTAAIGFIDSPIYDLGITSRDTQPDRVDRENLNI